MKSTRRGATRVIQQSIKYEEIFNVLADNSARLASINAPHENI